MLGGLPVHPRQTAERQANADEENAFARIDMKKAPGAL
jgi:hypothetical protein